MNQNRNVLPDNKEMPEGGLKVLSCSIQENGDETYIILMDNADKKAFTLTELKDKPKGSK